ncbi:MAG: alpha/beta fold hydrolase [Puniceicoccaceae bacterium]|nr:MAG: alpha/beta fold hydrolase [Puniceicoccaceae bacterium]
MVLLAHRDFGGAGRPPLVILPGLLGSARNWTTAGADLAEDFHVRVLDLRNHGASPWAESHTYDDQVEDVLDWLDREEKSPVLLVGHSKGGKAAMRLACRHPERLAGLVVVDIAPVWYPPRHDRLLEGMRAVAAASPSTRREAEAVLEPYVPEWGPRQFVLTNLIRNEAGGFRWGINLDVLEAHGRHLEDSPLEAWDRFGGPALLVRCGRSDYVEAAGEAAFRRHFPAGRVVTLPESGHNPHIDDRAELVRVVRSFGAGLRNRS